MALTEHRVDAALLGTVLRFNQVIGGGKWAAFTSADENPLYVRKGVYSSYYRPRTAVFGKVRMIY